MSELVGDRRSFSRITSEADQLIFGPFQRLHRRTSYDGTGMGLAICRRIVEHHGGRIVAESREGEGATFRVTLAAAGAVAGSTPPDAAEESR